MKIKRAIIIVLDSVGIGELPDAYKYNDQGSNTVKNIYDEIGLEMPNMVKLGFSGIEGMSFLGQASNIKGAYGKMMEQSLGKDTTTGHWEISGLRLLSSFPTYPDGFPSDVMDAFVQKTGNGYLGNKPASGTEIIKELGKEHIETGKPIVYTSADSVFQIACHEEVYGLDKLYKTCEIAREILIDKHAVARVIARPFVGEPGSFERTSNRKDFSLKPLGKTVLDAFKENGYDVRAVGKIEDIFAKMGITHAVHTTDNMDGVDKTIAYMKEDFEGLIFTNLVDFDMKYGHRNNVVGYRDALESFDARLPEILDYMKNDDILFITADHGCDPTTESTDHSREYVPLVVYSKQMENDINLGIRETFSDIAATLSDMFKLNYDCLGRSFINEIEELG